jgi:hypothetical protein
VYTCVRREASEFVWWYYQVTAWTAEESTASLNSLFGTVRRRSRSLDRHMFWKKGIRLCYDVIPMRQCKRKVPMTYIPLQSSFLEFQGRVFVTECSFLRCLSTWFFFVCCCFDLPTLYLFLLSHEMNIIPVTVDSVTSLTSAKRAWMLIVRELIVRGRSTPKPRTCSNYAGKNRQFHFVSRHLSFQLRNLNVFWWNGNHYVDRM